MPKPTKNVSLPEERGLGGGPRRYSNLEEKFLLESKDMPGAYRAWLGKSGNADLPSADARIRAYQEHLRQSKPGWVKNVEAALLPGVREATRFVGALHGLGALATKSEKAAARAQALEAEARDLEKLDRLMRGDAPPGRVEQVLGGTSDAFMRAAPVILVPESAVAGLTLQGAHAAGGAVATAPSPQAGLDPARTVVAAATQTAAQKLIPGKTVMANVAGNVVADEATRQLLPLLPVAGARAKGGPVEAGKPYLVGEQGPEIVVPAANGQVIPNSTTQQIMARSTHINGAVADIAKRGTKGMFGSAFPPTTPSADAPPGPTRNYNPWQHGGQIGSSSTLEPSATSGRPALPALPGGLPQPVQLPTPVEGPGMRGAPPQAIMPPGMNRLSRGAPAMGLGGTAPVRVGSGKPVGERVLERQARRGNWRAAVALYEGSTAEAQRKWQSGESATQRTWQSEQAETQRGFQQSESATERAARSTENAADREHRSNESQKDRDWRETQAQKEREANKGWKVEPLDPNDPSRGSVIVRGDGTIFNYVPGPRQQPGMERFPGGVVAFPGQPGLYRENVETEPLPPGVQGPPRPTGRTDYAPLVPRPGKPPAMPKIETEGGDETIDPTTGRPVKTPQRHYYFERGPDGLPVKRYVQDSEPGASGGSGGAASRAGGAIGAALGRMKK